MTKAIGLLSGGLDSRLAVRVLLDQGITVLGLSFVTPFFSSKNAEAAARQLKIPLRIINFTDEHLAMVRNPKHGYGSNMNPCIDCHALMLRQAGEIMGKEGFNFIFTGEVLGERPMSQNRSSLMLVAKESGYRDYVLRPLSARLLPETKPELEGKVDRSKLLDMSGRGRKRQIELARHYGLSDYPNPASGCLLTDPGFSKRLKDIFKYNPNLTVRDLEFLKYGRHFRLNETTKLIVGRNQSENEGLLTLADPADTVVHIADYPGPIAVLYGKPIDVDVLFAATVCAFYSDMQKGAQATAIVRRDGKEACMKVKSPLDDSFKSKIIQ